MSENKNTIKWGKFLAIILCIVVGVLANETTTLQKAWFGRTVIGGPMLAKYLFAAALAGVGFKIKFKDVFSKSLKPIALGGITWLCVAITSYAFGFLFAGYIG